MTYGDDEEEYQAIVMVTWIGAASLFGTPITRRMIVTVRAMSLIDPMVDEVQHRLRSSMAGINIADEQVLAMLEYGVTLNVTGGLTREDLDNVRDTVSQLVSESERNREAMDD
jgi:hypothetical protein